MEDPERSNMSSLDLYSDMIGETEGMNVQGRRTTQEHSIMSSMDLYEDMLGETEEITEEADLYSDMHGETEGMSVGGRGQAEEHSVMSSMDLYEDIIEEERENEKFEELRSEVTKTAGQMEDLMAQMEDIQSEKQTLAAENQALKKNISALFVTAKAELDRKQKEIARLRADLEMMQMRRGAPRIPYSARPSDNRDDHSRPGPSARDPKATREASSTQRDLADRHQGACRQSNIGSYHQEKSPERESRREGPSGRDSKPTREASSIQRDMTGRQQSYPQVNLPDTSRRERTDDLKSNPDHSRPGSLSRESTITQEASSSHSDLKDRQHQHGKRNNMTSHQQGESPDGERSRKEVADVLKSHPEHHRTQTGDLRCSQSPERDKDRRDGARNRACRSKHSKPELKSRETKEQTAHKIVSVHATERTSGEGRKPRQVSQDTDKLETKEREAIEGTDKKASQHVHAQEKSKSTEYRDEVTSPHGPHTPSSPYPFSEEEVKVGQTSPKEAVTGGPKTPPEPYPYEDAVSRNLRNYKDKHHKQEGRKKRVADDESRRHSGEGKKDSAYCSSGSESLSRNSREKSVEDKREEDEKYRRRKDISKADLKSRKQSGDSSREKHENDGRSSHEKSSEDKRTESDKDGGREHISKGDLRQKLHVRQKKESRNRSQERSSDDYKRRDHDKRRADEQRDHNSRKSKEDRHGKESDGRTTERGRRKHREERSTERDRSNARLQREERRNSSRGDKSDRSQPSRDTREAHKRKRSSSGELRRLEERTKVSPPRKKQYGKDSDGRQQSREMKKSSSRHRDRSEGRDKERLRRRSSERADRLHDNSKEPDRRGHRSKFVSYRYRSEDSDGDPDRYRSLSVETNSTSGSSSACSVAALNDVQKYLPTSFEGSLRASRSREAGLQESGTALTSPVGGSYISEEPLVDMVGEGTGVLDGQAKEEKSQKQYRGNDEHLTSPLRGRDDRGRSSQNSPDCATDRTEAVSSQHSVPASDQLQATRDESEMEEVTSTTTEQPDRRATVREKLLSESAEELGMIFAPVKRKREDAKQEYVSSPAAKKKKAAQNSPTKKTRLSPRKNLKESPSKKVTCSPTKSPQKIPQEGEDSTEITPSTFVSPPKTPKKSPQTSPKKAATSPHKSSKKVFKSPQKTPRKSSVGTPKKKSKSPKKTENLVEKCRSIVWTGKSARGKTVNLFHIEYETGDHSAREVFRNSPLLSPVKPPTPLLNLSARSSDVEPPSGEDSCSLPLPAISAQLKTDNKLEMERPVPCYHGNLGFSGLHGNTGTSSQSRTETVSLQQREQRLSESSKIVDNLGFSGLHGNAGTSSQDRTETVNLQHEEQRLSESSRIVTSLLPPIASSEDTCRSGSSIEEQDFPSTQVPFSRGLSEISEMQQPVSVHLPTNDSKQQTNSSESTGPFEVSINAGDATKSSSSDSNCEDNMLTQDGHTSLQKSGDDKGEELVSTEDNSAEDSGKGKEREELHLKTDGDLRRSVESSLLSISNEFDSSTANLSNEELFAVEVLAQLAAAAKTPTQSPVKPGFSLQQMSPQKRVTKKSPMKVAVTGSTPFRLFSPGRMEPTIAAEVEVGSGCTPKKGSRQRKGMDSPFIPPQQSTSSNKTEKDRHISKKGKKHKKGSEKVLKEDEIMLNHLKRDRNDSKLFEEVVAMSEEDNKNSKSKKAKQDKVPPLEVKPLRSSPRKPHGDIADAAKLHKPSPRKSPRKASTATPVKSREATNKKKSPTKSITSTTTTDISKQKTKDSKQGGKVEASLQESKTFTQHEENKARESSTSPPTPGNDELAAI
ncbi:microtubule-associated protein futsch-like [Branchiostoma floridae]|uniref:Microtubule-associated protein futsch-like n=1 Tax=Branchiostoma floridae TaxID=7739 RepID=A0A9J7KI72_BRAFL|nr:microtubule-associated protein futsch-like [Branchiostoma floridae]